MAGGERQVSRMGEMAWLWDLAAICEMIFGLFDERGVVVSGLGAREG
jgi:hypothetical protein